MGPVKSMCNGRANQLLACDYKSKRRYSANAYPMDQCDFMISSSNPFRRVSVERGFTLLELLVSITIVSLLTVSIVFSWRIATTAWSRSSELVEEQRQVAAVQALLRKQVAAISAYAPFSREWRGIVFFQGEQQVARFLSRYSLENRTRSGLYLVEYLITEETDGTKQLLMNETALHNPEELRRFITGVEQSATGPIQQFLPIERSPKTRVLLTDLEDAHLEYYRPATQLQESGEWVEQWLTARGELPRGIAFRLAKESNPNHLEPVSMTIAIANYAIDQ